MSTPSTIPILSMLAVAAPPGSVATNAGLPSPPARMSRAIDIEQYIIVLRQSDFARLLL